MISVPVFPEMRPIAIGDKDLFGKAFALYPPEISEFTFTNLFAWRRAYNFLISRVDDVLLVVSDRGSSLKIFDPIGPWSAKGAAIERCFAQGKERGVVFVRIPHATARLMARDLRYEITPDPDNDDYVYRTRDLIELKGRDYDAKRNFIKRFRDEHRFVYKRMAFEDVKRCFEFENLWCLAKDCVHSEGLMREREALEIMLAHSRELGVVGGLIEVDDKVEAVALGEPLAPNMFVVHAEKANGALIGIYQAINQMFIEAEASGFEFVNREQDLGVPGLRQSKESYHPCRKVAKYTIRLGGD